MALVLGAVTGEQEASGKVSRLERVKQIWRGTWSQRIQVVVALSVILWSGSVAYGTPVGREYLLQFISNFGDPGVCWVRNCLSDEEHSVRLAAYECLDSLGERAVPVLVTSLKSEEARDRLESVLALSYIGDPAHNAGPALLVTATDENERVRASSMMAICRVGVSRNQALPVIFDGLSDDFAGVRQNAVRAVMFMDIREADVHQKVCSLLYDHSADVRAAAVEVIGMISDEGDTKVDSMIEVLTQDQHPQVRMEASRALARRKHMTKKPPTEVIMITM